LGDQEIARQIRRLIMTVPYISYYDAFNKVFLMEMPQRVPGNNDFDAQLEMLIENLRYSGNKTVNVTENVFKLKLNDQTTYWVGNDTAELVSLIVDIESTGKYSKVALSSKNQSIPFGLPPYASDLYSLISKDMKPQQMVFTSDDTISHEAERLWTRLVAQGKKISVYDNSLNKFVLRPVSSGEELANYIGGPEKKKFVFVLSESDEIQRGIMHSFNLMEIKRLANWPVFERE